MSISTERINAARGLVLWLVRGTAVVLLAGGAYLCLKRALFAAFTNAEVAFRSWADDMGEANSLYRGLAMLAVGTVLALGGGRLSRWIIAVPDEGCPRCGHAQAPGAMRCPECGLQLTATPRRDPE